MDQTENTQAKAETKPKAPKMVTVYNSHKFKSLHLGRGRKIPPCTSGRIPLSVFNRIKDQNSWIQRAERGDVVK